MCNINLHTNGSGRMLDLELSSLTAQNIWRNRNSLFRTYSLYFICIFFVCLNCTVSHSLLFCVLRVCEFDFSPFQLQSPGLKLCRFYRVSNSLRYLWVEMYFVFRFDVATVRWLNGTSQRQNLPVLMSWCSCFEVMILLWTYPPITFWSGD